MFVLDKHIFSFYLHPICALYDIILYLCHRNLYFGSLWHDKENRERP